MPLQNRVTPTGEIIAHPARGALMGNRGILHDDTKRLGPARWRHKAWIACLLDFKGRHRSVMSPGRYTELFFLDEAVALAAGHRPCAECRRADYRRFVGYWADACVDLAPPRAPDIDRALHAARIDSATRGQRTFAAALSGLPDGTFIHLDAAALLVWGDALYPYTPDGYAAPRPRGSHAAVTVLTPAPLVRVLQAGYRPATRP